MQYGSPFTDIINTVVQLFFSIYIAFQNVWGYVTTPIKDLVYSDSVQGLILSTLVDWKFGDYTILNLMLGGGITLYIGFQFAKWVLDVVQ